MGGFLLENIRIFSALSDRRTTMKHHEHRIEPSFFGRWSCSIRVIEVLVAADHHSRGQFAILF